MPLTTGLNRFKSDVAQCESLIANAHKENPPGTPILPPIDREQITVAAFLNMFIAWESFLEVALGELMIGTTTISGRAPVRYVTPLNVQAAQQLVIGVMKFFDYANHQFLRKVVGMYFENGYPFEPHLGAIYSDLDDLRTIRNSCAHISSTTQTALESLAVRIFGGPKSGISVYQMLTNPDPRATAGETVFISYKNKLIVTAELICQG